MKKLLFIIVFLTSGIWLQAQDIKPGTLKNILSPSFSIDTPTGNIWIYEGSGLWKNIGSRKNTQFSIDSLSALGYTKVQADAKFAPKVSPVFTGGVTIQGDLSVDGDITASKDVVAYIAGAVSSDVLDNLTATAPVVKTGTNLSLAYDPATLGIVSGKLAVIGGGSVDVNVSNLANYYTKTVSDGRFKAIGYVPGWGEITSKPTTVAGYGLPAYPTQYTDAMADSRVVAGITNKVDKVTGKSLINDSDIAKVPDWDEAHVKTTPLTVTSTKVTIDRDLEVTGNITASKEVTAWIAGAVTSDVLSGLTGQAPLFKVSGSVMGLHYDTNTLAVVGGQLTVIGGTGMGGGTVTSVDLTLPSEFSVTGNPISVAGALAGTWNDQAAGKVFASQATGTGRPTFRALVSSDIPTLNQNTTGNAAMWGGQSFINSETITQPYYAMIFDVNGTGWKLGTLNTMRTWLGLGSNAYNSTAYLPTRTFGTIANSNTGDYLPIVGGVLTGALAGTSATFSGPVSANNSLTFTGSGASIINNSSDNDLLISSKVGTTGRIIFNYSGGTGDVEFRNGIGGAIARITNTGAATFGGSVTTPSAIAPLYSIKNASGVVQWTVSVNASNNLEFKNASGVVSAVLDQAGNLTSKSEITAYGL